MNNNYLSAPMSIDFDITFKCNQRCLHCNVSGGDASKYELSTDEIFSIIDEAHEIGVGFMSITGGEPLMRSDWREILRYATRYDDWCVILNTNGTMISENDLISMSDIWRKINITLSIDGYSQETYSILRRNSLGEPDSESFFKAINVLDMLIKLDVKNIYVNYTLTSLTMEHFIPTCNYLSHMGINNILGIKFFLGGRGFDHKGQLELPYDSWKTYLVKLTELKIDGALPVELQLTCTCPWEIYLPLFAAGFRREKIEKIWTCNSPFIADSYKDLTDLGCSSGKTFCAISADGQMYPCGTLSRENGLYPCGNVLDKGLLHVWRNSHNLKKLRNLNLLDLPENCQKCTYKSICGGGCRGRALNLTGKIDGADLACPFYNDN